MADQPYQQQIPGEGDPTLRKVSTSGETSGNSQIKNFDNMDSVPFAGDTPTTTNDPFLAMQRAQEAAAGGVIPTATSETDPTAKKNINGDNVEGIHYTGGDMMGQNFDNAMQIKGAKGVSLEDMTAGMSNNEIKQSAHENRFETGAQLGQSQALRAEQSDGLPATGEDQENEAQGAYEAAKAAGVVTNGVNASSTERISVAATGQAVDFTEEKQKLEQAKQLVELADSKMTARGGNTNEAISGLTNFTTETGAKIEELKKDISEAEELSAKIANNSEESSNNGAGETGAAADASSAAATAEGAAPAANINEAMNNMRQAAEKTDVIDYSESYKQAEASTRIVNPGARAEARKAAATNTPISRAISHGGSVEMNNTWGQVPASPEKMPTPTTTTNLTPEQQQEALRRAAATGESQIPRAA